MFLVIAADFASISAFRDVLSGMDSQWQTLLFDTVYKEAKKSNPDYRLAALKSLKSVVGCFKLAKFEELWAFVRPFLVDTEGSKSILGSDDESDDLQKKKEREEIKIGLTAALYSLMADSLICQSQNAPSLMEFLELLGRQLNKSYWKVQQPMIQCYVNVVKFHVENIVPSCLDSIATVATQCRDGSRQSTLVTSTNELLQLIEISRNRV